MTNPSALGPELERALALVREARTPPTPLSLREVGFVRDVGPATVRVTGLPGAQSEELLRLGPDVWGVAFNLDRDEVGVVLLGDGRRLRAGDEARRSGRIVDVPVGRGLLGRVVTPLGEPLDRGGPVRAARRWPIERAARPIHHRAPVAVPLQTGLKVVDALVPVGRGQRQLILGDRQTGKTAIALDAILNQRGGDVVCVYCAIGQRGAAVAQVVADLRAGGASEHTVVVVASGEDPPGLQYVAPYAATTIAEYFMEQGRDVLVVYDDLTRHAQAYRELSLLLRRPPGREAFPGDIFYIHSRLLERATRLRPEHGGGSLTALPIIETEAQNLSGYVPTNVISITDGQIYLSPELFQKGVLPAVDVGRSISRVGGKAQLRGYREIAGALRLSYSQFQELEVFARFVARLDDETRRTLDRGHRVREVLKQGTGKTIAAAEQLAILFAVTAGLFDAQPVEAVAAAEARIRTAVRTSMPELCARIEAGEALRDQDRAQLLEVLRAVVEPREDERDVHN